MLCTVPTFSYVHYLSSGKRVLEFQIIEVQNKGKVDIVSWSILIFGSVPVASLQRRCNVEDTNILY